MNQLLITCLFIISWWHSKCSPQMLEDRPLLIAKSLSIPHIWHLHELITFLLRPFPESFSMSSSTYTNVSFRVVYRWSQSPHASVNAESTKSYALRICVHTVQNYFQTGFTCHYCTKWSCMCEGKLDGKTLQANFYTSKFFIIIFGLHKRSYSFFLYRISYSPPDMWEEMEKEGLKESASFYHSCSRSNIACWTIWTNAWFLPF